MIEFLNRAPSKPKPEVPTVGQRRIHIACVRKAQLSIDAQRRGVLRLDADLHAVIPALPFQKAQEQPEGLGPVAPVLESGVHHELLKLVAGGLLVQIPHQGQADRCVLLENSEHPGPAIPVYIPSGQDALRRVQEFPLVLPHGQPAHRQPVVLSDLLQVHAFPGNVPHQRLSPLIHTIWKKA